MVARENCGILLASKGVLFIDNALNDNYRLHYYGSLGISVKKPHIVVVSTSFRKTAPRYGGHHANSQRAIITLQFKQVSIQLRLLATLGMR